MAYFVWSNNLKTGHALIDDDHQKLVGLINALYDAIAAGKGQEVVGRVLEHLISYCEVHFQREELEMQRVAYGQYAEHKLEHENFIVAVNELKKDFDSGANVNATVIGKMLSDWLRNHIAKVDIKLAAALRGH